MAAVTIDPLIRFRPSEKLRVALTSVHNVPKKLKDLTGPDSTLELKDIKWIYENARGAVSFHELMTSCEMVLPSPVYPPRNPELEARIKKLRAQQENREYNQMTRNIDQKDALVSLMMDQPISVQRTLKILKL